MDKSKVIKKLTSEEIEPALALIWDVFARDCAPYLSRDEATEYLAPFEYEYILHRHGDGSIEIWGAFENKILVGVMGMMDRHRILFIHVLHEQQHIGIGSSLLKKAALDCKAADETFGTMTAHVTVNAVAFFEKMGFAAGGEAEGSFLPMILRNS